MSDAVNPAAAPRPAALLTPPIPVLRAGQRFTFKQLVGSSDAALIAQTASAHRNHYSQMVVLCASALDAQRLLEEIPTFAPQLNRVNTSMKRHYVCNYSKRDTTQ